MQVLMIRHGRTDWNDARRIQGRTDVPLNATGRAEQSRRTLPDDFKGTPVFASPLSRAIETAELLGAKPRIDEALIEMDFGAWEGRTHADLVAENAPAMAAAEAMGVDMRPPEGETPREVGVRLTRFLSERGEDRIAMVTHKGVIRAAFALALDWDMQADLPFRVDWNAGQVFGFDEGSLSLVRANLPLTPP